MTRPWPKSSSVPVPPGAAHGYESVGLRPCRALWGRPRGHYPGRGRVRGTRPPGRATDAGDTDEAVRLNQLRAGCSPTRDATPPPRSTRPCSTTGS